MVVFTCNQALLKPSSKFKIYTFPKFYHEVRISNLRFAFVSFNNNTGEGEIF